MATARWPVYFADCTDPAANAPSAVTHVASSTAAPSNGSQLRFTVRDFDSATDETMFLKVRLPGDYASGGALITNWLSVATSGNVVWKWAWVLIHPSSEGTPTDLDAAAFGTVTAEAAVATPATAGHVKEQTISLGLTGAHPGDLLYVMLGRDADNASDTMNANDARLLEPMTLTYSTTLA